VQGEDRFFVAAEEVAYMHRRLWSFPEPGAPRDMRSYPRCKVREAGRPRVVSPLNESPNLHLGKHAEY